MVLTIPRYPSETTRETTDAAYLYESTTADSKPGSAQASSARSAEAAAMWPTPTLAERKSARITRRLPYHLILRRERKSRPGSLARDFRPAKGCLAHR